MSVRGNSFNTHPETNDQEHLKHDFEGTNKSSSQSGRRALGDVQRHDEGGTSDTETSQDTTSIYHADAAVGACLDSRANSKEDTSQDEARTATKADEEGVDEEGSEKAASLESGNDVRGELGLGLGIETKSALERGEGQSTTDAVEK